MSAPIGGFPSYRYDNKYDEKDQESDLGHDDPRRTPPPIHDKMDDTASNHLSKYVHDDLDDSKSIESKEQFILDFTEGDKRNPMNYPQGKKWAITLMACTFALFSGIAASTYNTGFNSMTRDLNCTRYQANIGLALFALGFGILPLVTSSFSEELGRQPLYIVSSIGFLLMFLMIAKAKNIQTVLLARFFQGAFGSTGSTMVGGTIADIWSPAERGVPMSLFALAVIGGIGLGPSITGWIEHNPRLEWRWIQWIQMICFSLCLIGIPLVMSETRSAVLLMRMAKKKRKETGNPNYKAKGEDERPSMKTLLYISLTRPVLLLLTEPLVLAFSLWVGLAWGIYYCMISSISLVFKNVHHFNIGQIGTTFITMAIGSLIGFFTNLYQERLYKRDFAKRGPEARLHLGCVASIGLPIGMLIYAWTSFPRIPWIAQMIGITVYAWSTFTIYLVVFSYLADCYGPYASSALAGQSLLRNMSGMAFPLFTTHMFNVLGYKWANTLFGLLGVLMIPIPFTLFFYGPKIRSKSKVSRMVMEMQAKK